MTNFIPIFPLNIVVYPGESLHLHIFEPRYKQLINECYTNNKPFGIPVVLKDKMADVGTLITISEIVKVYDNGEMDIKTKGDKVFTILEVIKEVPDKLFSGAIVNYPNNNMRLQTHKIVKLLETVKELHKLLNVKKEFAKEVTAMMSYDIAHHVGLDIAQEYELLGLLREDQRLEFIKRHLEQVIPVVGGMENLKERIKLNGHFKELKGFNL